MTKAIGTIGSYPWRPFPHFWFEGEVWVPYFPYIKTHVPHSKRATRFVPPEDTSYFRHGGKGRPIRAISVSKLEQFGWITPELAEQLRATT